MASRKKKPSRGSNLGCLILLAGLILLAAIFAIKFPDIKATLDSTKFLDLMKQRATTTTTTTTLAVPEVVPTVSSPATVAPNSSSKPAQAPSSTTQSTTGGTEVSQKQPPLSSAPPPVSTTAGGQEPAAKARQSSLFFVKIEDDGVISRREVKRNIPVSDSPLTDAINALIAGPSEGEIRSGLVSLIPRGTKLLGITVRGSTAIIDLSDAFMYNHYGIEGYSAQLKQIVYTATSFASVQDVQILVEGKLKEYLGGEGVYIGKPLSRNSF